MAGLRLPTPAAPLPGLPAATSPEPTSASARRPLNEPASPNGKQRSLTDCPTDQLETMLVRTSELLGSLTLGSLSPTASDKLRRHREALEVELRHRAIDEGMERARLDEASAEPASARTSPAQAMRTRLLAQPALDVGRMRGISMEATMALESDAAARRRAQAESTDFTGRLRELKIGTHAPPRFGCARQRREPADSTATMHTSLPTTTAIRASPPSMSRRTEATWRTSTRARAVSASRRRGRGATPRPTTMRRRGDERYSRTRMPTMASPSMPSIEIHACVFTASVSAACARPTD